MPDASDCLRMDCWQALFGGRLPPEQRERYELHLEGCAACQALLDRADECGEAMRRLVRRVGDVAEGPASSVPAPLLARLHGMKSAPRAAPVEPADLYFLRPSDRPGLLGTLDEYQIVAVVGRGAMGIVLKAFDQRLSRVVAIKVMAAEVAGSATARRRFIREARATAAVCHENVVTLHAVQEAGGLPYLVMQHVDGESLQTRLDRTGPLEIADVLRIGAQTASGLAAAHAQGLIHRDITPGNLLLENGVGRVKICDFGLARVADDVALTRACVVAGTPEYMAPEQARAGLVDHRADLYSLGAVLYALCSGRPPFRGDTIRSLLRDVSERTPAPLRSLNPDVPARLEAIVIRLLAKDPGQRFQSASEVAELLEGCLDHLRSPERLSAPRRPAADDQAARGGRPTVWLTLLLLVVAGLGLGLLRLAPADGSANQAADEPRAAVRRLKGHTGTVHDIRFAADGRLVSGSGWPDGDRTLRVWDAVTGRELFRIATPGQVQALDVSADGRHALAGLSNREVLYVDLEQGQVVGRMRGHGQVVGWVGFAPDGRHAFSASSDGTARMWDLSDGSETARFRVRGKQARGGAAFPDGNRFLTGDNDGALQVWDLTTQQEVKRLDRPPAGGFIHSLRLAADGRQAFIASTGGAYLQDLETGQEIRHFQEANEAVNQLDLSPDGRWLLTGGFDCQVRLWDVASGELVRVLGSHDNFVFSVAFSPDGLTAASAGGGENNDGKYTAGTDHDIRLWDITDLARASPAAPKSSQGGWVAAVGVLVLLAASLLIGALLFVRHIRRGQKQRSSERDGTPAPATTAPPIVQACSGCGKKLRVNGDLAGRKVKCPACGQIVAVPTMKAGN
jgi:serine/threonine protein kinase/WD40 repeat protein